MRVTTINPITDKRWDRFVVEHQHATIFHHSAWARVLSERYGHSPTCYVLESDDGEIVAGVPFQRMKSRLTGRKIVCLPCSELCFPLSNVEGGTTQLITGMKEEVDQGQLSYLEIRGWRDSINPSELGFVEHPYYLAHTSDIAESPDTWMSKINRTTRRNLRRAKESLDIREAQGEDDLKEFHRLSVHTRTRVNLLPWPYDFSKSIYQHIIVPGHGFLLLTELKERIIGGTMCFRFGDTVFEIINTWDSHYSDYRVNYLLIWEVMKRSHREGYRWFDFGVSNPENEGLLRFKRQWWTEENTIPYYYYPSRKGISAIPQTSFIYKLHTSINKITPEFGLKFMGRIVYRHMG